MLERFRQHLPLKSFTTLGIGGPATYFIEVHDTPTMQTLLPFCEEKHLPYFILGKGSNSLFDDRGFSGLVIANRILFLNRPEQDIWHVGAGYSFSLLGAQTARQGWSGLEFASGIPGSVGGAIFMNAGANGAESCQTLVSVDFVSPNGQLQQLRREELDFGYRYSSFQAMKGAIVGASFRLSRSTEARHKQLKIIEYRTKTQPYNAKSAGCVFRNPSLGHAGALIEQSGLKGKSIGDAEVSMLHANFLINKGNASAADMLKLVEHVRLEVKARTGIELILEIHPIPFEYSGYYHARHSHVSS